MNKPKLLFITQDLAVGGGTSSLSSLYSVIRKEYEVAVFLLCNEGEARVAYKDAIIYPSTLTDLYYRNSSLTHGCKRYASYCIKGILKALSRIGLDIDNLFVYIERKKLRGFDSIISYGEGVATLFAQHINTHPRSAWIHYEVSKAPYSDSFIELYKRFDHIVTVSTTIASQLGEKYPQLAPQIVGIHNVIDVERINELSQEIIPEKFSTDTYNIISLGRIAAVKRFALIPQIARKIKDAGCNIRWRIYGPQADTNELTQIQANIDIFEVNDIVEYCGNRTNPYPYLKRSDLFVILSSSEACPMVITEARILNVPILSTNFSTAPEFIENDVDGVIRPIEMIAHAIIQLSHDERRRDLLLDNSAQRIQENNLIMEQIHSIVTNETI